MNKSTKILVAVISLCCCLIFIYFLIPKSSNHVHPRDVNKAPFDYRTAHDHYDDDFANISNEMSSANEEEKFEKHRNFKLFNSEKCGTHYGDRRITKGNRTKLMANPWMAALVFFNEKTNSTSVDCAGTLISENLVLTAAHCFPDNKKPISIRLGDYNLKSDPDCTTDDYSETTCADKVQEITDFKVLKHEYYFRGFEDIALIKLNTRAKVEQLNINTICLPFSHKEEDKIENYYITGWGRMYNNSTLSDILLGAFVPFVENDECKKTIKSTLTRKHLCAGIEGSSDSCKGDSGGPLSHLRSYDGRVKSYQFGIVSYGPKSGCGKGPGVYTKVYSYLDWILDNADF